MSNDFYDNKNEQNNNNSNGNPNQNEQGSSLNNPQNNFGYNNQPNYGMPSPSPYYQREMSLGEWVLTLFLVGIPCVNLIMLLIWAFGDTYIARKNFARASLIFMAIGIVLSILYFIFIALIVGVGSPNYY